jgi:hypothetical protein
MHLCTWAPAHISCVTCHTAPSRLPSSKDKQEAANTASTTFRFRCVHNAVPCRPTAADQAASNTAIQLNYAGVQVPAGTMVEAFGEARVLQPTRLAATAAVQQYFDGPAGVQELAADGTAGDSLPSQTVVACPAPAAAVAVPPVPAPPAPAPAVQPQQHLTNLAAQPSKVLAEIAAQMPNSAQERNLMGLALLDRILNGPRQS